MAKPYRQAIMGIILKPDGSFLIGSSPRDGGYKFPQGGLEADENPERGLIREIKEELGIVITQNDILLKLSTTVKYHYPDYKPYAKTYSGQEMHVFVIKIHEHIDPVAQDEEFDQFYWITPEEMTCFDFQYRRPAYEDAISQIMKLL